jgi:hypothetical protein
MRLTDNMILLNSALSEKEHTFSDRMRRMEDSIRGKRDFTAK